MKIETKISETGLHDFVNNIKTDLAEDMTSVFAEVFVTLGIDASKKRNFLMYLNQFIAAKTNTLETKLESYILSEDKLRNENKLMTKKGVFKCLKRYC